MTTTKNETGSVSITLSEAIVGPTGAPLATLTLRRPIAKDMRAMDGAKGEIGKSLALAAHLSGVPAPLLDNLDGTDFLELSDGVQSLLQRREDGGARTNADGTFTLPLPKPIGPDGGITEITVRRAKAKDFRVMDAHKGPIAGTFALASQLSGIAIAILETLDCGDFLELGDAIEGFHKPSPATGE